MLTLIYLFATLFAIFILIYTQPANRKTIFEPAVFIIGLFSFCYLLPLMAVQFQIINLANYEKNYVDHVSIYGFVFVVVFSCAYLVFKKINYKQICPSVKFNISLNINKIVLGITILFGLKVIIFNYYEIWNPADYAQQYIVRAALPPVVNQTIQILSSLQWVLVYLLIATCLSSSLRSIAICYIFLTFLVYGLEMLHTNSRSNYVLLCITLIGAFNLFKKPIGLIKEAIFGITFILVMNIFAFKRVNVNIFNNNLCENLIPSEFISIFENAVRWFSILETPDFITPPTSSYLQALIAFVPKQLNEKKWDLAEWYVNTMFSDYAEAGGGVAFGIIPEAIVNWGLLSIAFQAIVLAAIYRFSLNSAYAHRSQCKNVWVIFYLFCFSQIYQSIRSHSFSIISGILLGFAFPVLLLFFLGKVRFFIKNSAHA